MVVFVVVGVITLIQLYSKAYRNIGYDYTCYLTASKAFLAGKNPYTAPNTFPFIYPLFFVLLIYPLAIMPYWLSNLLWFFLNLFALVAVVKITLSWFQEIAHFQSENDRDFLVPIFLVILLFFNSIQNNFLNGQVNLLLLLFCVLFFNFVQKEKDIAAALFLALGILIKWVPAILILFLIIRKKYKALVFTGVFWLVGMGLPLVIAGDKAFDFYHYYWNYFLLPTSMGTTKGTHTRMFFTLEGFFSYLFPSQSFNKAETIVSMLLPAVGVLITDLTLLKRNVSAPVQYQGFGLYLLGILLISPMSQTHHQIYVLPLFLMIVLELIFMTETRCGVTIAGACVFVVLFSILGKLFQTGPWYFFSFIILFILNLKMMKRLIEH